MSTAGSRRLSAAIPRIGSGCIAAGKTKNRPPSWNPLHKMESRLPGRILVRGTNWLGDAVMTTPALLRLREKFPDYFYKEATLNPTNPRDRATDWESDIVNQFRAGGIQNEFVATREAPTGAALVLARPIRVNNVSCLECHSTPDKAPAEMIKLYGTANGFNWKMDDIIGAQIVSVPILVPLRTAEETFRMLLQWLGGAFGCILIAANLGAALVAPPKT